MWNVLSNIVVVISCVAAIWAGAKWLIKFDGVLNEIAHQFRPNHGSSLRDRVDAAERSIDDLKKSHVELRKINAEQSEMLNELVGEMRLKKDLK